jgi:hypothetical protein
VAFREAEQRFLLLFLEKEDNSPIACQRYMTVTACPSRSADGVPILRTTIHHFDYITKSSIESLGREPPSLRLTPEKSQVENMRDYGYGFDQRGAL